MKVLTQVYKYIYIRLARLKIFIKLVLIGPKATDYGERENLVKKQLDHFKMIWRDQEERSYGLVRLFRFYLCLFVFITPSFYIRHLANILLGYTLRKLVIETTVLFKVAMPIIIIFSGYYESPFLIGLLTFNLLSTISYILSLVFLTDIYHEPHSSKRSVLLLFLNYIEATFTFAALYKLANLVVAPSKVISISSTDYREIALNSSAKIISSTDLLSLRQISDIEYIYFSFITSTTVGYGDYLPTRGLGQFVVMMQSIVFLIFLILFVNHFISIMFKDSQKYRRIGANECTQRDATDQVIND